MKQLELDLGNNLALEERIYNETALPFLKSILSEANIDINIDSLLYPDLTLDGLDVLELCMELEMEVPEITDEIKYDATVRDIIRMKIDEA